MRANLKSPGICTNTYTSESETRWENQGEYRTPERAVLRGVEKMGKWAATDIDRDGNRRNRKVRQKI